MARSSMFLGTSADEQFKHWATSHPDDFYINIRSQTSGRLHKASCWHLGSGEGVSSTSNSKICSNSIEELRTWAQEHSLELIDCTHCL